MTRERQTLLLDRANEAGPRVSCVCLEGQEVFVFSVPLCKTRYPEGATGAEREVIDLTLRATRPGLSFHDTHRLAISRWVARAKRCAQRLLARVDTVICDENRPRV